MSNSNKSRFERLNKFIEKEIDPNPSLFLKLKVFLDVLWERIRYNNELIDYDQYRFYYKKRAERNKFVTHGKLLEIIKVCNNPNSRKIFDDKRLFNNAFKSFLGRDYLEAKESSYDEIMAFFNKHDRVFSKNPTGMFGKGVSVVANDEINTEVINQMISDGYLLEEVVTQHAELAKFNPTSVNSLRVVTLVKADDSIEIKCIVLRFGRKGNVADNFHFDGIAALVDVETGIVKTQGVDRYWNRYTIHPDSKESIVGFQIPEFNRIKETCLLAAKVHPEVRYVGWDVTVGSDNQIIIIEGNPGADPDITQIPDQVGKWYQYDQELERIKAKHEK